MQFFLQKMINSITNFKDNQEAITLYHVTALFHKQYGCEWKYMYSLFTHVDVLEWSVGHDTLLPLDIILHSEYGLHYLVSKGDNPGNYLPWLQWPCLDNNHRQSYDILLNSPENCLSTYQLFNY